MSNFVSFCVDKMSHLCYKERMNLRQALSDDEITQLALLPETGAGRSLLRVLDFELKKIRSDLEENPVIAEDKKDFRFKAGVIAGLKIANEASKNARLMVEKTEERKES